MMIRTLAFLSLLFPMFAAAATIDQRVAFELFQRDVHPFLRKNCSECHGEGALGWSGPPHSYADPKIAFGAFFKRINFDLPEKSAMFTQARNQHFCKEFASCNETERRSTEAMAKIMQYISNVKASSAVAGGGSQSADFSVGERVTFHREYEKTAPFQTADFELRELELPKNKDSVATANQTIRINKDLSLMVSYQRAHENIYVISGILAMSRKGIYAIQNLRVLVNGQQIRNNAGLENLDLALYFTTKVRNEIEFPLTLSQPVLAAKPGDKVSLSFGNILELDRYPSLVCDRKKEDFADFYSRLGSVSAGFRVETYGLNDLEKCYRYESMIDVRNPRRSPILYGSLGYEGAARAIEAISKFIE